MTSSGTPQASPASVQREQEVTAFLRANPAFLDQHPELLAQLSIPHASGDAVSLMERQVSVLRDENAKLKQQLGRLLTTARQNENLNTRIHALVLSLMDAVGPQAIFERLELCLREDFRADFVATRVFAERAFVDSGEVPQFVGCETAIREPFAEIIGGTTTVCGVLNSAQRAALFDEASGALSAVMMPLVASRWDGMLVIASADAERYEADMGTEFLTYLKDVVTLVVDPWVKRAPER